MSNATTPAQRMFAIVELFGHARIAGEISEQTIGGQSFVRIDVPDVEIQGNPTDPTLDSTTIIPAHTRSFGAGAIYAINWVDEKAARLAAQSIRDQPISPWSLKEALRNMPEREALQLLGQRNSETLFD